MLATKQPAATMGSRCKLGYDRTLRPTQCASNDVKRTTFLVQCCGLLFFKNRARPPAELAEAVQAGGFGLLCDKRANTYVVCNTCPHTYFMF
jgi:hypothetical protein